MHISILISVIKRQEIYHPTIYYTPHLVGWTPTVQNSLPALHGRKKDPQVNYIKHLARTKKAHPTINTARATGLTIGLGDFERLPGLLQ
jgi:hypothetical protein